MKNATPFKVIICWVLDQHNDERMKWERTVFLAHGKLSVGFIFTFSTLSLTFMPCETKF